jgi:hypothetical protein
MKAQMLRVDRFPARCALAVGAGLLLASCGGGGGSPPTGTSTQLAGLYLGSSGGREVWAVAARGNAGQEFYAVSHLGSALGSSAAVVYSGAASLGTQGEATVVPVRASLEDGSLRSGTATLSHVSATTLSAGFLLNDDSAPQFRASYSATATPTTPSVDALAGSWTGSWLDSGSSNTAFQWTAPPLGGKASITPLAACPGIEIAFSALDAGSGLYRVQLKYPNEEQCTARRDNKTLSGLAAVHGAGLSQELRFTAVDASGSGIIFVGRRAPPL